MAIIRKPQLFERVTNSIIASGWNILYLPSESNHFLRLQIYKGEESYRLRIYIWNLTHGGGQLRPTDEMRIQVTGVDHFENVPPELTLILGWWAEQDVFAAFDFAMHSQEIGWSASIQIRKKALEEAHKGGFGIWRKDTEIVVAVKPEYMTEYIRSHDDIHAFGNFPESPRVLEQALQDDNHPDEEFATTPAVRKEVLVTLRKRSREVSFQTRVLNAYTNSCAMCNVQLRLIDAAHILPVSADGSSDETCNGIALCAIHHRAYDRALVTFNEDFQVRLNNSRLESLEKEKLGGGTKEFMAGIRPLINLPPSKRDRPHPDFISQANLLRGWNSL